MLWVNTMAVPADAWREWAGDRSNLERLRRRAAMLGVGSRYIGRLVQQGVDDPSWRTLAARRSA